MVPLAPSQAAAHRRLSPLGRHRHPARRSSLTRCCGSPTSWAITTLGGARSRFADELAHRFEEQAGHILLKSKVVRIVTRNGRAVGVEVETGPLHDRCRRVIASGVVVSNADLRLTALKMMARDDLDPRYLKRLAELRPTYPCFLIHIGVEGVPTEIPGADPRLPLAGVGCGTRRDGRVPVQAVRPHALRAASWRRRADTSSSSRR